MLPYLWAATNARDGWEAHADYLLGLIRRAADLTLAEICDRLERVRGEKVSPSMIWRFFDRHDITLKKKSAHASEQDRPDVRRRRREWFAGQLDLDPLKLVFVDETGAATNMARRYGRRRRGRRLRCGVLSPPLQSDHLCMRPASEGRRRAQGL